MSDGGILVVGGCGFTGFHIVNKLLESRSWPSVHVMSRKPTENLLPGADYHAGDICSAKRVNELLDAIKPVAIIHTASPRDSRDDRLFFEINVQGTRNLLDCAVASRCVKAFVYTSSVSVAEEGSDGSYYWVKEDAPLKTMSSRCDYYTKSKAIADQMVLQANGTGGLRTVCLRVCTMYGERDNQLLLGLLEGLKDGRNKIQIGSNTNLFDTLSSDNAASAHVLALKALLRHQTTGANPLKVDGEAFCITDGDPIPFWDFARKVWTAAGDKTPLKEVKVIPAWLMLGLASVVEWLYWIFTLGQKTPTRLRRHLLENTCKNRVFSIEKATERLGYRPTRDRDYHIERGVRWAQKIDKEKTTSD